MISSRVPSVKRIAIIIPNPKTPLMVTLIMRALGTFRRAFLTSSDIWIAPSAPMKGKIDAVKPLYWLDLLPQIGKALHEKCCPVAVSTKRQELVPNISSRYMWAEIYDRYQHNNESEYMADQYAALDQW